MLLLPSQSLLSVHDAVAQGDFEPTLPPMPDDVLEDDEDSVKIVSLVKTKEPLVSKVYTDCYFLIIYDHSLKVHSLVLWVYTSFMPLFLSNTFLKCE